MQNWHKIPQDKIIEKTKTNLSEHGITTEIVATKKEAREKVLALIPEGSQVMDMTSVTLTELGLQEEILHSGKYDAVKIPWRNLMRRRKRVSGVNWVRHLTMLSVVF